MGVNFPDVRYIVNWGPARSIFEQHQEAGRAGRDDTQSHVIVIFHGQQIEDFVHAKGCFRVAAYKMMDATITPLDPLHDCCSFCLTICTCAGEGCGVAVLPFEAVDPAVKDNVDTNVTQRQVKPQDRETLKEAFSEVLHDMRGKGLATDKSSSHGFSR